MNASTTAAQATNRVLQIIFIYWVIKIAATTRGETGAAMVSMTFNIGYATTMLIFLSLFLLLLGAKLAIRKYEPAAGLAGLYLNGHCWHGDL